MKEVLRTFAFRKVCILLLLGLALPALMVAQSAGFGDISGVVQDPSGAVISGARVVVDNADKGIRRELISNSAGIFAFPK